MRISPFNDDEDVSETPDSDERYEEFLRLFAKDRHRIFAHVFSLIPHEADAEDVFQRCSIVLWRKFPEYNREYRFLSWACGIAVNEVRNFLKTRRRSRVKFFPEPTELLSAERLAREDEFSARGAALRECIDQLRPAERNLIQITYWEEQSLKEFADVTGSNLQVLYNQLSKIRRTLFACIKRKLSQEYGNE